MDCKISKRTLLCAVVGPRRVAVGPGGGSDAIFQQELHFLLLWRHVRGSGQPPGSLHGAYGARGVEVRWLWTERLGFFAPTLSFQPDSTSNEIARRVCRALVPELPPEELLTKLNAYEVQRIDGRETSCHEAFRVLRAPGDGPLASIARAAGG